MSEQRVCFVSGGASGIGAACVRAFRRQGWAVAASYYGDEDPLAAGAPGDNETGFGTGRVLAVPLDVADDASCREAVRSVLDAWGRIDALVNCAGTTRFVPHEDLAALDAAEFRRVYDVNVIGTFQLTRACAAALAGSGAGSVVNVSSIAGLRGSGSSLAYAASKGAVNTMTLSLARSLAPTVRVNAIAPGFVDGGLPARVLPSERYDQVLHRQRDAAPLRRVSQPAEIAELAWFLCAQATAMTGQVVAIDNGLQL